MSNKTKREQAMENVQSSVNEVDETSIPVPAAGSPAPASKQYQGIVRSKLFMTIPLGSIVADPGQPRRNFDDYKLAALAANMKRVGQLQPIIVWWDKPKDRYTILGGERRFRAAGIAGMAGVECKVIEDPGEAAEVRARQISENLLREDLDDVDEARAINELIHEHGWTQERVGGELGFGQSRVSKALSLLRLPGAIQEKVREGGITAAAGHELARVADPAEQSALAQKIEAEGLTHKEVQAEVSKSASKKPRKGKAARPGIKLATSRTLKTSTKMRILVTRAKGFTLDDLMAALIEIREQISKEMDELKAAG